MVVAMSPTRPATAAYAPLARATSELIVDRLDDRGFATRRSGPADLRLQPKLIIWDGKPFLSMTATDRAGAVRWSAMLDASPGKVPPGVDKAFDDLAANFPRARRHRATCEAGKRPLSRAPPARRSADRPPIRLKSRGLFQ